MYMITYKLTDDKTIVKEDSKMIYLDHAATTKIDKQVLDVFTSASEQFFGNESSLHDIGTKSNEALKGARTVLASSLQAELEEVFFTSGGTESNQLALMRSEE